MPKRSPLNLKKTFWNGLSALLIIIIYQLYHATFVQPMPTSDHPAILYSTETGDDLQLIYKKAIGEAKESVVLTIYSLLDNRIIKALRTKAEEGITVTVIADANASKGVDRKLGPKVNLVLRKPRGLMHQKILVIDQQKVWIGSANMTMSSLKTYGNLVLGFDDAELAKMLIAKAKTMSTAGLVHTIAMQKFRIGEQNVEMWFFPDCPNGAKKLQTLLQGAKKSIKVAMFTFTRMDLAQEIINAKKRGVKTEVVIDRNSSQNTSIKVVNKLMQAGVAVRSNTGSALLHHKCAIIDGKTLVNGSANWTLAAFNKNDDCFVVIENLTTEQKEFLHRLWKTILRNSKNLNMSSRT